MFLFTLFTITISLVSAKNCPAPPVQQNFNIPNVIKIKTLNGILNFLFFHLKLSISERGMRFNVLR